MKRRVCGVQGRRAGEVGIILGSARCKLPVGCLASGTVSFFLSQSAGGGGGCVGEGAEHCFKIVTYTGTA